MADQGVSSTVKFLRTSLIIFFSASIVMLGAHEMDRRHKRYVGKGVKQHEVGGLVKDLRGTDLRASISRKAVKESSGKSDKEFSAGSLFSGLFPSGKGAAQEESDHLSSSDRRELDSLIGKVAK